VVSVSTKLVFLLLISVMGSLGACSPVASPLDGPLHALAYGVRALEVYTDRPTSSEEKEK